MSPSSSNVHPWRLIGFLVGCVLALGLRLAYGAPATLYTVIDLGGGTSNIVALDDSGNGYGQASGQATQFTPAVVPLGFLPGGTLSAASGQSAGRVVGSSGTGTNSLQTHAFLRENGVMVDLGTVTGNPAFFSAATSINAATTITGHCETSASVSLPCVWQGASAPEVLPTLGGDRGYADAINVHGVIVGQSQTPSGAYHATLWIMSLPQDLDTTGGMFSEARDINTAGHVVGTATFPTGAHAFLWDGTLHDLGVLPGFAKSTGLAINDSEDVVGSSSGGPGFPPPSRATMWSQGQMLDLNTRIQTPGWVLENATALNASGTIAVSGRLNGQRRIALLVPQAPAPMAAAPAPEHGKGKEKEKPVKFAKR